MAMNIQEIELGRLNEAKYNPRKISKDEFSGLMESLKAFGQTENLIVNKDMTLISGHQRLEAMKKLKWKTAMCNVVDLDPKAEKKLNVIMNSQEIQGSWDEIKLAEILNELKLDEDYTPLRLDKMEPLDLSTPQSDTKGDAFNGVDEESYLNSAIKQIVLFFGTDEFGDILDKLEKVQEAEGVKNNTDAFRATLEYYIEQHNL